jgi:hypothetical protein
MADQERQMRWRALGATVRGAAHVRAGQPNQDAIGWFPESGGVSVAVAVSDGHGSAKCFRSDTGARLAVAAALEVLRDFLAGQSEAITLSTVKRTAEERLPRELVRRWREAVDDDLRNAPLSSEELDGLERRDGPAARQAVEANPILAHGATILTVLVTQSFIVYVQLGDGDILTVTDAAEVSRPLAGDARLFANETTSLCGPHAWRDVRVAFQALSGSPPALILASTDGYANSYREDSDFLKVGSDLLGMLRLDGIDAVNRDLGSWLTEVSHAGSGDDVSLGILCRSDVGERMPSEAGASPPSNDGDRQ